VELKHEYIHVCIGNFNIDLTLYVSRLPGLDESVNATEMILSPGGAATNYAVAVSCYGHRAVLIAVASASPLVDIMLNRVRELGVDVSYVKRVEGMPGLVVVVVSGEGERVMYRYRGVNELLSSASIPREALMQASIVHMASLPPATAGRIGEAASKLGILTSYDPGVYAISDREHVIKVLDKIDILFLNRVEAKSLAGYNIESLLKYGPSLIVVKKGAGGAYVVQHGGLYHHGRVKPIGKPVNTTGAGDAFDAFFNAAYLEYRDVGKALLYALAAGTLKTLYKTSIMSCDKELLKKQLLQTSVEVVKEPDEWVLED